MDKIIPEMKNVPEKIYLQIGCEDDPAEDFNDLDMVSWCQNKINTDDIEYVRSSALSDAKAEIERLKLEINQAFIDGQNSVGRRINNL